MNINKVIFGYRIVNANIINCRIINSIGRGKTDAVLLENNLLLLKEMEGLPN
jgi:hypothetical protein